MRFLRAYLDTLNPSLPRSVRTLQAGALVNALGNGLAYPFLFIYLHNVRGFDLATAGLIVGTSSAVGLVAGPLVGTLVDRVGGRLTLAGSLWLMALGFGGYVFVEHPWQGFLASAVAGAGNGGFWPSQSSLIAGLTPQEQRHQTFAMQRVMMNLGIGLGGLTGGLIATTSDPDSFTILFLADAATFVLYSLFLTRVPPPRRASRESARPGGYGEVVRNRVFMGVVGLNFAGPARVRSGRPQADRPLHGGLGVLVGRRLHGWTGRRRRGARSLAEPALAGRCRRLPGRRRRCACTRAFDSEPRAHDTDAARAGPRYSQPARLKLR